MLNRDLGRFAGPSRFAGLADFLVTLFQLIQLFVGKLLDIDKIVVCRMVRTNEFVKLQVQRLGVAVLRVLDEEDHKKRNDFGAGINDELPGIREMEKWPARGPKHQNHHGEQEHIRVPHDLRGFAGKTAEPKIEPARFPDLLVGFNIRLSMLAGHTYK